MVASGLVFADGLAAILVLAALLGVGNAIAGPAEAALVPATVAGGAADEGQRLGRDRPLRGFTVGPLLAGVLTAAGGTGLGLAANAASFAVVALAAPCSTRAATRPSPNPQGG